MFTAANRFYSRPVASTSFIQQIFTEHYMLGTVLGSGHTKARKAQSQPLGSLETEKKPAITA